MKSTQGNYFKNTVQFYGAYDSRSLRFGFHGNSVTLLKVQGCGSLLNETTYSSFSENIIKKWRIIHTKNQFLEWTSCPCFISFPEEAGVFLLLSLSASSSELFLKYLMKKVQKVMFLFVFTCLKIRMCYFRIKFWGWCCMLSVKERNSFNCSRNRRPRRDNVSYYLLTFLIWLPLSCRDTKEPCDLYGVIK